MQKPQVSIYSSSMTQRIEVAILAGGCFWGMEDILRKVPGVLDTEVGYTGGHLENPRYEQVKTGTTGHAEAIRIEFDSLRLSFKTILIEFFFKMHDPTTLNRQGGDVGSQYRSAIFFVDEAQRLVAEEAIREAGPLWPQTIVTELVPAAPFYSAETYHQDYLQKNPGGYTCHWLRR